MNINVTTLDALRTIICQNRLILHLLEFHVLDRTKFLHPLPEKLLDCFIDSERVLEKLNDFLDE